LTIINFQITDILVYQISDPSQTTFDWHTNPKQPPRAVVFA
jgi:hypothetical protein